MLLLAGCVYEQETGHQGTAVGNPGKLEMGIEGPPSTTLDEATVRVRRVDLHNCDGGVVGIPVGERLDLLDPTAYLVDLPGGLFCGLDPSVVRVNGLFRVDGQVVLLQLDAGREVHGQGIDQLGSDVTRRHRRERAPRFGRGADRHPIPGVAWRRRCAGARRLRMPDVPPGFRLAAGPAGAVGSAAHLGIRD